MKKFAFFIVLGGDRIVLRLQHPRRKEGYSIVDGVIVFDVPARAEGPAFLLRLTVDPIPVVRVGFIGLGMRGPGAVERFANIDGVEIVALFATSTPSVSTSRRRSSPSHNLPAAPRTAGRRGGRNFAGAMTSTWFTSAPRGSCTSRWRSMPWSTASTSPSKFPPPCRLKSAGNWSNRREDTAPLHDARELLLRLLRDDDAQHGPARLFGEILHTEALPIFTTSNPTGIITRATGASTFNQSHRGDVYATHGLGPACQLLDIHRGDKMNCLVAMDTKSVNGLKLAKEKMGAETFANADQTLTLIKTERGRTILLEHNVYTPRPYSRMYQLTGTEGFANKYPVQGYAFRPEQIAGEEIPDHENLSEHSFIPRRRRRR